MSARTTHRLSAGLAAIGLLLIPTACTGNAGSGGGGGDTLYVGTVNPPASFNPINQSDVGGQFAVRFAMDTLLDQPEPLKFVPKLADSIESKDNKTFTVKLHAGAKWSDGQPITAKDVVYTINLIANRDSLTTLGGNVTALTGVDATGKLPKGQAAVPGLTAPDDTTVVFTTKTPVDPNYVKEMIGTKVVIMPEHVLAKSTPAQIDDSKFAQLPDVTSGPYKFTKYTQNASIEYAANPDYYGGAPKIGKLIMKIMPASNLAGELQTGSIMMNSGGGIGNIPFQDLKTVKAFKDVNTKVNPTIGFQTIQFNVKTFADPRLRAGLAHAINRKQIVDELLLGNGEVIDGPYTSQSPFLDKNLKTLSYDPVLAKKLLTEAGWDFSRKINFVVPTGNKIRERSADILLQNFKAIGLNVVQTNYDFPTTLAKARAKDHDMVLMGLTFNIDPDVSNMYSSTGSFNLTGYNSPESDKLLLAGKSAAKPEARHQIYNQLQALWQADMPVLTLYSDHAVAATNKSVAVGGATAFWPGTVANVGQWAFEGAN
ncbi:peptide/nickel transport system substrate-binding protein [Kribbella sp. VKM Ac-2569]|uniref:ABC transporter substrate-binding protein n=1 Tax=Kribbella sp. VKM Ac-2569 TaxID=2512220 RepID=UPI00102C3C7C|nr:ABC transporter substrate-binding protein [Kribbella sp. VKM Ac-2569]RZT14693.1 peptide/nickel transport system substrate-binding protein [Kribbella sp. VKM Ac-2569]